jgi:putative restriction endonuclease
MPLLAPPDELPDDQAVLRAFVRVRKWRAHGQRAPHKPLLLLLALGALQRGERWLSYREVEPRLTRLLGEFGPARRAAHPEHPFWRLQADGIWTVPEANRIAVPVHGNVSAAALREADAHGGFTEPIFRALSERPMLLNAVAAKLLEDTFAGSLHEPLLDATGLLWTVSVRRRRDPRFREEILRIYERRCAVCGHDIRMGGTDLGLEAAHIRWHAAGGPDEPENGLALCSFHHVALDRGALTLAPDLRIQISQNVLGGDPAMEFLLLRHLGAGIRLPQRGTPPPSEPYLHWHRREVFQQPERKAG